MSNKKNGARADILLVDDDPAYSYLLTAELKESFNVTLTENIHDSLIEASNKQFVAALVDINLHGESGLDLVKQLREINRHMGIIVISTQVESFYSTLIEADDVVVKTISLKEMVSVIKNAIYKTKMPAAIRRRRAKILSEILPHKSSLHFISREVGSDVCGGKVEVINVVARQDLTPLRFVVYNLPEQNTNTFTIGLASTVGCGLGCAFCLSGQRKFIRKLSVSELTAQVLYGLDSYHAMGVFQGKQKLKPCINFTCEGDVMFYNIDNAIEMIVLINRLAKISIDSIITSIGNKKTLQYIISHYAGDLTKTKFYWSVNEINDERRARIMPATKGQKIIVLRDAYQELAEITNTPVTASFIYINGLSNTKTYTDEIARLFANRPFIVKIMPLVTPDKQQKSVLEKADDMQNLIGFCKNLESNGVPCRVRNIIGSNILAGCGTTIPQEKKLAEKFKNIQL